MWESFGEPSRKTTKSPPEYPWLEDMPVEVYDRYAPARAKADGFNMVIRGVSTLAATVVGFWVHRKETQRIDRELGF